MSRCSACNAKMTHSPLFIKLDDGTVIPNQLCNTCSAYADDALIDMQYEHEDSVFAASYAYVKTEHKRREWN